MKYPLFFYLKSSRKLIQKCYSIKDLSINLVNMQLTYKLIDWELCLSWDNYPTAHHYRLEAMTQTFIYSSIATTLENKYKFPMGEYGSYIRFKVVAESKDDTILFESNEIIISCSDVEKFNITAIDGYYWTTLAFRSKWVYDLYKVYDKNTLIAETEDPVLPLSYKITKSKLNDIVVEWYMKIDGKYMLLWISGEIAKLPKRSKSKDYKISVVIPVYNSQIFLPRTVDSILSSSISDIELILVDDGSTDDSLSICNWYAKKYTCVFVIKQKNQRVAVARNNWILAAHGEYLWFVDNDDVVHPLMYEKLYNASKENGTDVAIAPTVIRNDINSKELCLWMTGRTENIIVYTYDEVINNMHKKDNMYFVAVWNKIAKTDIVKKTRFPTEYPNKIVLYEDSAYTPLLYSYADRFVLCKDAYYIWDKRKQKTVGTASTMHKKESADDIWKSFIYAHSYPIYNSCKKHKELCDYACFERLIQSYDKFTSASWLYEYWNQKLKELIISQKLNENKHIMADNHLKEIVNKLCH